MSTQSLEHVAAAFVHWRNIRSNPKCHTPKSLQQQAIALLAVHSEREIVTTLQIKAEAFRRWQTNDINSFPTDQNLKPEFAVLPTLEPETAPTPVALDIHYPNGIRLHLQGEPSTDLLFSLLQSLSQVGGTSR